jgi:hypothetical protein
MNRDNLNELLYQALETEQGGVQVYETALRCAVNGDLKGEWGKYLEQTRNHVEIVSNIFAVLDLDVATVTPGRKIVREKGQGLVKAMEQALGGGKPEEAQLVAAECIVDAEMKDHQNWELLDRASRALEGDEAKTLKDACEKVESEEDEHLYHTAGWVRELWLEALGLPAVLPPPEERKHVETELAAAKAKQQHGRMLRRHAEHHARRH